jgi:hypothetical protein
VEDVMEVEFLPCPTCTQVTVVEMPPCADEHGYDCPDRACTMCGTALTVAGIAMFDDLVANSSRRRGPVASRSDAPDRAVA